MSTAKTTGPTKGVMSYDRFFQMAVTLDAIYWRLEPTQDRARRTLREFADELRGYGRQMRQKADGAQ